MVVVTTFQRDVIIDAVRAMYTEVAREPAKAFHFPTGRTACDAVGYPPDLLDRIPVTAVESFAGVGFPFAANVIRRGDTVLDVGAGSGTDALIACTTVGEGGRVLGLDMTLAMREKLRANAAAMGVGWLTVVEGEAEAIPLEDEAVDVVTSNGVLNLVPDKPRAFREIARVLKPGGWIQLADIVVETPPSDQCRLKPQLWAECIVGATTEADYLAGLAAAGLGEVEVLSRLDYFSLSASPETRKVASGFGAHAIVLRGCKPR